MGAASAAFAAMIIHLITPREELLITTLKEKASVVCNQRSPHFDRVSHKLADT